MFLPHNARSRKPSEERNLKPSVSEKAWFFGEIHKSPPELKVPHVPVQAAEPKGYHRAGFLHQGHKR